MVTKPNARKPVLNRDTCLDDNIFKEEQAQLASEIFLYKLAYCSIAAYCSLSAIFTVPMVIINLLRYGQDYQGAFLYNGLSLFGPCLTRPIFGWIGDWYFPGGYRLKGYCIFNCIINIVLIALLHYCEQEIDMTKIVFFMKINSVWLEAVALGVTSITIEMEKRLMKKKNPFAAQVKERTYITDYPTQEFYGLLGKDSIIQPSYVKSYGQYMLTSAGAKMGFVFLSYVIYYHLFPDDCYDKKKIGESIPPFSLKIPKILFIVTSIALILCMLLFNEKKMMKSTSLENRNKFIFKGFKGLFLQKKSLLIMIALLIESNPILNACSVVFPYFKAVFEHKGYGEKVILSPNFVATIGMFFIMAALIFSQERVKSSAYFWYLILPSLIYQLNIGLFCLSRESRFFNSEQYLWGTTFMAISTDNLLGGITKVFLIDSFIKLIPVGHEFFYVNLLTTVASFGKQFGVLIWVVYIEVVKLKFDNPMDLSYLCLGSLCLFGILPTLLYLCMFSKDIKEEKKKEQKKEVQDGKLALGSKWIITEEDHSAENVDTTNESLNSDEKPVF